MRKVIRPGKVMIGKMRRDVFIEINYVEGKLSIHGVIGPLASGNCYGCCGQIDMGFRSGSNKICNYAPGWSAAKFNKLLDVWDRWHLNAMRAGCEHQRKNWDLAKIIEVNGSKEMAKWILHENHTEGLLGKPCEICGYQYGKSLLFEPVPQDVINFLFSLPSTDKEPAWV